MATLGERLENVSLTIDSGKEAIVNALLAIGWEGDENEPTIAMDFTELSEFIRQSNIKLPSESWDFSTVANLAELNALGWTGAANLTYQVNPDGTYVGLQVPSQTQIIFPDFFTAADAGKNVRFSATLYVMSTNANNNFNIQLGTEYGAFYTVPNNQKNQWLEVELDYTIGSADRRLVVGGIFSSTIGSVIFNNYKITYLD